MNDIDTRPTGPGTGTPIRTVRDVRRRRRWALVVPAAGLAFETVVLVLSSSRAPDLSHLTQLGFWLYWAVPFLLVGALIWHAAGRTRVGWWLSTGLAAAISLAGVAGYVQTRTSVDASLVGLSGPLVQAAAVLVVGVVVLVLARRSSRQVEHRSEGRTDRRVPRGA